MGFDPTCTNVPSLGRALLELPLGPSYVPPLGSSRPKTLSWCIRGDRSLVSSSCAASPALSTMKPRFRPDRSMRRLAPLARASRPSRKLCRDALGTLSQSYARLGIMPATTVPEGTASSAMPRTLPRSRSSVECDGCSSWTSTPTGDLRDTVGCARHLHPPGQAFESLTRHCRRCASVQPQHHRAAPEVVSIEGAGTDARRRTETSGTDAALRHCGVG